MTELYLPLSNHAVFCQWHYYIPSFKFLDTAPPPQSLPTTNRLVKFGPPNPRTPHHHHLQLVILLKMRKSNTKERA